MVIQDLHLAIKEFLNNERKEIDSVLEGNSSYVFYLFFGNKNANLMLKHVSVTCFKFQSIPTYSVSGLEELIIASFISLG